MYEVRSPDCGCGLFLDWTTFSYQTLGVLVRILYNLVMRNREEFFGVNKSLQRKESHLVQNFQHFNPLPNRVCIA